MKMENKCEECIGCYNIRRGNYPTNGYSEMKKAFIMEVDGWEDPNNHDKPISVAYIKFCPVCGVKLRKET